MDDERRLSVRRRAEPGCPRHERIGQDDGIEALEERGEVREIEHAHGVVPLAGAHRDRKHHREVGGRCERGLVDDRLSSVGKGAGEDLRPRDRQHRASEAAHGRGADS
jgi:hypothetical protein